MMSREGGEKKKKTLALGPRVARRICRVCSERFTWLPRGGACDSRPPLFSPPAGQPLPPSWSASVAEKKKSTCASSISHHHSRGVVVVVVVPVRWPPHIAFTLE